MEITNFIITKGTAPRLRFTLREPDDVTGWTTTLRLRDVAGGAVVVEYTPTITSTSLGVFEVPLTATMTNALSAKVYVWTFERTNNAAEDILGKGSLRVER